MNRKRGFTLVEIMAAAMLAGMILLIGLPLILTQKKIGRQMEEKENAILTGDAIFEYVKEELTYADRVFIGDNGECMPTEEDWKAIYVSGKRKELSGKQMELVMEACALEPCRLGLTVRVLNGEETVYERTEELELLNLALRENGHIEGCVGKIKTTAPEAGSGETPLVLWYQKEGGEE